MLDRGCVYSLHVQKGRIQAEVTHIYKIEGILRVDVLCMHAKESRRVLFSSI